MARTKNRERKYSNARERAMKAASGFESSYLSIPSGAPLFQPKAGVMLLDIVPYIAGKGNPWADEGMIHWERTFFTHPRIGPNSDTYICLAKTNNDPCPVCEYRSKLLRQGGDEDEIKELAPKQRQLFNVYNRKEPEKGIQLWEVSYHLFGKLLDARIRNADEEDEWDKFFFLEEGLTLRVGFVEQSFGSYSFLSAETIDFKPRKTALPDEFLDDAYCLDDILKIPSYEDLKKVFLEMGEDEDEENARPAKPARKTPAKKPAPVEEEDEEFEEEEPAPKKKAPAKKKPEPEPEDDEDLEEDWEEFEEEEEEEEPEPKKPAKKPASKSTPKKKPAPEPEEEDEEEWEEEEEEDEPAPPKKKVKKPEPEEEEEEEDEWEDWEEEEEEDEPAPKKKARSKS